MPETTQIEYSFKDLTALMIRDRGITEGEWMVLIRFSFAAATMETPGAGPAPSMIAQVTSVGISRVDEANPLSVNAASLRGSTGSRAARRAVKMR